MAYTALYRKFRPQCFADVIGQEHIVRTLKNQIKTGRVSHAYLFCGTRGTGKTSTAKIFARAINCLHPTEQGEPCNQCELCKDILAGRSVNVIEIDAASNNGVEDIREIREEVKYPPAQGRFKVYIIDEVHMLSNSAFNALLKTLEEPPAHVIFILATTDPQKVPATILSRVQRFDFRRITTEDIAAALKGYLAEEGYQVAPDAVRYIARLGDGSMRDSLSILDQCLAFFSAEEVTLKKVQDIMGAVDRTVFFETTEALSGRDAKRLMELVEQMLLSGRDVKQFTAEMLLHLRNLLMAATLPDPKSVLDLSAEDAQRLQEAAGLLSPEEIIYLIRKFSDMQADLRYAPNERILLEVELMKLCAPWAEQDLTTVMARVGELERRLSEGVAIAAAGAARAPSPPKQPAQPKRKPPALPEDKKRIREQWVLLRSELGDGAWKAQLSGVDVAFKEDDLLYLVCEGEFLADLVRRKLDVILHALEQAAQCSLQAEVITKAEYEKWQEITYGKPEKAEETAQQADAEFASLMGTYFPEADME